MITKEDLERIKQGDGLTVESNGIRHYNASEVLINGHSLTEVLEAAEAYKEEQPKVLDADGIEIKPGDELYYNDNKYSIEGDFAGIAKELHTGKCPNSWDGNKPWVRYKEGGWDLAKDLTHQKPETLQDLISDLDKGYEEYWGCGENVCSECPAKIDGKTPHDYYDTDANCTVAMYEDIERRIKAIAKRMGGGGGSKADSPVEIPKQKTCPHCGSSHVITTKVITIGEGRYSEAETDLCLTCGRDLVGDSE